MWHLRILLIATTLSAFSCTPRNQPAAPSITTNSSASGIAKDDIQIVEASKFPKKSAPFSIVKATIVDDTLELEVSHGGGCETHEFSIYWDGIFLEESPLSATLFIDHDDKGDTCEALISSKITFNLKQIKEAHMSGYPNIAMREVTLFLRGTKQRVNYSF